MNWAAGVIAGVAGLALGSWATTAAIRASRGEQFWTGRSHCDACGIQLGFARTAPVVSFVAARGACRNCGAPISPAHLVGESAAGLGLGLAGACLPLGAAWIVAVVGVALLAAAVFDARTQRLPDALTAIVAAGGGLLSWRRGGDALIGGAIAAALVFVLLGLVRTAYVRSGRRQGLGFGDVKLIAALALWLGPLTPMMVAVAAIGGLTLCLLRRPQGGRIAFGPMIALAAWGIGLGMEAGWWPASL